jgi:hypothetical protein
VATLTAKFADERGGDVALIDADGETTWGARRRRGADRRRR